MRWVPRRANNSTQRYGGLDRRRGTLLAASDADDTVVAAATATTLSVVSRASGNESRRINDGVTGSRQDRRVVTGRVESDIG